MIVTEHLFATEATQQNAYFSAFFFVQPVVSAMYTWVKAAEIAKAF